MSDKKEDTERGERRNYLEQSAGSLGEVTSRSGLRKLMGMSRRKFLSRMAALGASSAALSGLTKEAVAKNVDDPQRQVIRLFGEKYKEGKHPTEAEIPERKPVYYSIPLKEYIRTQGARNAANRLEAEFQDTQYAFGLTSLDGKAAVAAMHITYGSSDDIRSSNGSYETFKKEVPESVTGTVLHDGTEYKEENIPVIHSRETVTEQYYFDDPYRPVPGGCQASREQFTDNYWTIGLPAYSYEISEGILTTASHTVNRESGIRVEQPSDYTVIGESNQYTVYGDGDVATIDPDNAPKYDIAAYTSNSDDYMGWDVIGTVGSDKLDEMVANGEYAYRQGTKTGRDYAKVVKHFDKNADSGPKVRLQSDSESGDSGGGYWILDENDDAFRVGIHAAGGSKDGTDFAQGNTFYYAENKFNLGLYT